MKHIEDNDYYKSLGLELEGKRYWSHFRPDLEERVRAYDAHLSQCFTPSALHFAARGAYTAGLVQDYAHLVSTGERNKKDQLNHLQSKLAEELDVQEFVELDEEAARGVYRKLGRTREARAFERLRVANDAAFNETWTDVEILNLLKGVVKYGEHSWSEVCEKYEFKGQRTANALALQWKALKSQMLRDVQTAHEAGGVVLSRWEWVQGCVRRLEARCGRPGQCAAGAAWHRSGAQTPEQRLEEAKNNQDGIKWQNAIQQLRNKYVDCMGKFKKSIEAGNLNLDDVKKYVASKDTSPTFPKYFELHYVSPKVEETKKAVFRLHSKEELERASKANEKEQPISLKKMFLQKVKGQLSAEQKEDASQIQ